jgi:adenylate cyclase
MFSLVVDQACACLRPFPRLSVKSLSDFFTRSSALTLACIAAATAQISKQIHVRDVIASAVPLFMELLHADRCSVFMLDHGSKMLRTFLITGHSAVEISIPVTKGVVGFAASNNVQLNIPDAYQDPRFDPRCEACCSGAASAA